MRSSSAALVVLAVCFGCGGGASTEPSDAARDRGSEPQELASDPLPARTWRLSHAQYAQAVRSFLGVTVDTSGFEDEIDNSLFTNMSGSGLVRTALARDYYDSAETISSALSAEQIAALIPGQALGNDAKQPFVRAAIRRAFRRPATPDDLAAYAEIFDLGADASDDATSPFRAVIRALLTSPFFLYRTEIGGDPTRTRFSLSDHEFAALLSFSLLGTPPSEALLAAADSGELSEPARLAQQVSELLELPEAATQLRAFLAQWLEIHRFDKLEKDPTLFPDFAAARPLMNAEANAMLALHGALSGSLHALLTAPVLPNAELATYYASEPSSGGSVGSRTGILGLGAVVAAHSRANVTSPTLRGLFVRDRLLCQQIHLPADGAPNIVDTLFRNAPKTTRALYEQHAANPECAGCHALLDAIGFNFEDLDASGRFRSQENMEPIDTSGELVDVDGGGPTRDRAELALRLAQSSQVEECFARQAFRFYLGAIESDRSGAGIQAARTAVAHGTFRELLIALLTAPSARERVRQ